MPLMTHRIFILGVGVAAFASACSQDPTQRDSAETEPIAQTSVPLTVQERLDACEEDPRVVTGLVSVEVCAGADIFFRETFEGNGRTCGTCHRPEENLTIDTEFIAELPDSDPLFVFEQVPALADLETPDLRTNGGILENVDGFEDPTNKFVVRGVPHILSMSTSIAPDTGDGTTIPPVERTGWGGDGPGDGSLRAFLLGAIEQHFPLTLNRVPGTDFRVPTPEEEQLVLDFQLSTGRLNELNLQQVNMFDPGAQDGRLAFMDPDRGRCNFCHDNAGANSEETGLNRNFDTGTRLAQLFSTVGTFPDGSPMFDGGFGSENVIQVFDNPAIFGLGNNTFSTPPVIESVDTPPFFHTNAFAGDIEGAVAFYGNDNLFGQSASAEELEGIFGSPIVFEGEDINNIGRFLRVLNAAFNLDIAKQRLRASQTILNQYQDDELEIQLRLIELAEEEIDDAIFVLTGTQGQIDLHEFSIGRLGLAKDRIAQALAAPNAGVRGGHLSTAISRVENARDHFGANINYDLGEGNLMF